MKGCEKSVKVILLVVLALMLPVQTGLAGGGLTIDPFSLTKDDLYELIRYLNVDGAWAAPESAGTVRVEWSEGLFLVGEGFQEGTEGDVELGIGTWWNTSKLPAILTIGPKQNYFELPPNSLLAVRSVTDLPAFQEDGGEPVMMEGVARTLREFQDLLLTSPEDVQFVRSRQDWERVLDDVMKNPDHPLAPLSNDALLEFTDSLTFSNGGLASFKIGILTENLTLAELEKALAIFRIGFNLFLDGDIIENYKCDSPGTCKRENDFACTSSC